MKTVSERSQRVRAGLTSLSNAEQLANTSKALHQQLESVRAVQRDLGRASETLAVARRGGFAPAIPECRPALESFDRALGNVGGSGGAVEAAVEAGRDLARTVRDTVQRAWQRHIDGRLPSLDGLAKLVDAFVDVEGAAREATRLHLALEEVRRMADRTPTDQLVATLDQWANEIPAALTRLVGDDPEVRRFAEQTARGGASLASLTPVVRAWLADKRFEQSFKIVAGRPAEGEPS